MEMHKILLTNYLPYAKSTIVNRAIPSLDGFKPVQRRILYTMNCMKLADENSEKLKSTKIIGDVMGKYHPHGDSSIYDAMALMTTGYDAFNTPYLLSKGNFGKKYSRDIQCSAHRYTEVKLTPICNELFDGIKENSVDIVPNFDDTEKEPTILPVKFPSILVNSSAGVAVGTSSNIPSFPLKNVCSATIGVANGTITNPAELSKVLGSPEFTTGGFLHADEKSLEKLCATGKGSFVISGRVEVYSNQIVITEIPYTTTAEDIIDAIDKCIKEDTLKGVKNVRDEIGFCGLRIIVEIKAGYNSREVLRDLCRLTPLRTKVSFRTRVIVNNRCRELSLLELIQEWINFREQCITRMSNFRVNKDSEKEYLLSSWEKIKDDLKNVVNMISSNTESVAKQNLMSNYGLDEMQADYILDMKIRSITKDRAEKAIKDLKEIRETIKKNKALVDSSDERKKLIIKELGEISDKYGTECKTTVAPELTEDDMKPHEIQISDEITTVILTKGGYIRRVTNIRDLMGKYVSTNGDEEVTRWSVRNNEYLLVFDRFGTVHKILVDDIDQGRGKMVDRLYEKAGIEKEEDMIYVDVCGDYTGYFNLIYPNGRGTRVLYNCASGNRKQYKSLYDPVEPGKYFITKENQFFLVTGRMKASYCDITRLGAFSNRTAFKVARLASGDWFSRLVLYKDVPNKELINLDKYYKDYTVSIGDDVLWVDEEQVKNAREKREKLLKQYNDNTKEASNNSGSGDK